MLAAEALRVLLDILATLFERHDVIALAGKPDKAKALALCTQRFTGEQLSTQTLQLAPCDSLRSGGLLHPGF
jgi:hypothetical protein